MSQDNKKMLESIDEKKKNLEIALENYAAEMGLNVVEKPIEVEQYLKIPMSEYRTMNAEELGNVAYFLAQYGLFIQKEYNRHYAIRDWAKENIKAVAAPNLSDYGNSYVAYDEKMAKAIADNDALKKLKHFEIEANKRINNLSFIAQKVEQVSRVVLAQQQVKRYRDD